MSPSPSVGLYVHLPFCASRCAYCTFVVTTSEALTGRYLRALRREMALAGPPAGTELETLYFGGGTPSRIPAGAFSRLVSDLTARYPLTADAEVTAEANPEDVSGELLAAWADAGVNRISVGVQSFVAAELSALDRRHDVGKAVGAIRMILETGRFQLNADLMLGIPRQTSASLARSLDVLIGARPHHVSVYMLEMDKPHRLRTLARRHPERFPDDDDAAELYLETHRRLTEAGYEHYEISNFALPGCAARHNLRYWRLEPVYALGVAAHGMNGGVRWANLDDLNGYLMAVEGGTRPLAWKSSLFDRDLLAERALLGLRLAEGVDAGVVSEARRTFPEFAAGLDEFIELGLAEDGDGRVHLTPRGWLVSNELFRTLV